MQMLELLYIYVLMVFLKKTFMSTFIKVASTVADSYIRLLKSHLFRYISLHLYICLYICFVIY